MYVMAENIFKPFTVYIVQLDFLYHNVETIMVTAQEIPYSFMTVDVFHVIIQAT